MSKSIKILIAVLVVAILSVPIGVIIIDKTTPVDRIYEGVKVNNLGLGGLTKEQAIEKLEKSYNDSVKNKKISVVYEDFLYEIDYNSLDAHYEVAEAAEKAVKYGKDGNAFTRSIKRIILKNKPTNIELKFLANNTRVADDVKKIAKEIDKKAKNATISYNGKFNVTKEQDGLKVDTEKLDAAIKAAINPKDREEKVDVPTVVEKARVTEEALSEIDTKIDGFSTQFNGSISNRVTNIKKAANAINGTVLLPGEVFSTNQTIGQRTKSNGYKDAKTIVNGEFIDDVGGGVCQVSTTLYNAVLLSDLEIVERSNHSLKVGYVDASLDAVIAGDYLDFKFKNNTKYPIYIQGYASGSSVGFTVYGSSKSEKKNVSITSEITSTIPSKTGGKPQVKSRAYRTVTDKNGKIIKKETLSSDHYKG